MLEGPNQPTACRHEKSSLECVFARYGILVSTGRTITSDSSSREHRFVTFDRTLRPGRAPTRLEASVLQLHPQ